MTYPYDQPSGQDPNQQQSGYPGYGSESQGGYPGGQPPQYGSGQPDYGQAGGYPGYPGGYGYGAPPQELPKGLAIAALVLGILALLTFWSIIGGIVLGIIAIVLGAVAIRKAGRREAGGHGMGVAGLVLGILGLLGGIIVLVFVIVGVTMFGPAIQECQRFQDPQRIQQCLNENLQTQPQSFDVGTSQVTIRD